MFPTFEKAPFVFVKPDLPGLAWGEGVDAMLNTVEMPVFRVDMMVSVGLGCTASQ
jgi:hypothetical protein